MQNFANKLNYWFIEFIIQQFNFPALYDINFRNRAFINNL